MPITIKANSIVNRATRRLDMLQREAGENRIFCFLVDDRPGWSWDASPLSRPTRKWLHGDTALELEPNLAI